MSRSNKWPSFKERSKLTDIAFKELGKQRKDWRPIGTFYNTGRKLFFSENMNPKSQHDVKLPWRWMKYRRWNSFYVPDANSRKLHCFTLNHLGHIQGAAVIRISARGHDRVVLIPRCHRLHVIDTVSEIKYILDFRPIPWQVFERAFETERKIEYLESLSQEMNLDFKHTKDS